MKNVSTLFIALSLGLAACGGDDGGTGDTDVTPTTTMTPTGGDDGTPTAGDDDGMPTTAGDDDGMDDGMATTAGDTMMMDDTAGMDTTGGGGGAGSCNETCKAPTDCAAGTGTKETYACTDGFCEFIGDPIDPCDPTICPEAAGYICASIDGNDVCGLACPKGDECAAVMQECVMDDKDTAVCQLPACFGAGEGEPCEIAGFGQIGTCSDGVCGCTADTECTAPGQACQAG